MRVCDAFNERFGLNEPIPTQFVALLGQLAARRPGRLHPLRPTGHRDPHRAPAHDHRAGASTRSSSPPSSASSWASSPPSAATPRPTWSRCSCANLGVSIPIFVLALILQFVFAVRAWRDEDLFGVRIGLPPSGRLSPGLQFDTLVRGLGPRGPGRTAARRSSTSSRTSTPSTSWSRFQFEQLGRRRPAPHPAGHRAGHHPLAIIARITRSSPAGGARPRLHPHRARQGRVASASCCASTPSATPCCRS